MNESKDEQVKNFWRFHRSAEETARALNIPLARVVEIYEAMTAYHNHREARLVAIAKDVARRLKISIVLLFFLTVTAHAQTISPVVAEYGGKKASGNFAIRNNGITPITVVVEPALSLTFVGGKKQLKPLDPGVHVEFSKMSARLGAHQTHQFDYKLTCDVRPCAVTVYSTLTGPHASQGLAIALHLPMTIYLCEKQKNCRASIRGAKP